MTKSFICSVAFFLLIMFAKGQAPDPAFVGYWHNWDDANAPYIPLDNLDLRYNIIIVAFAIPHPGTDYQMEFTPDQESQAALISRIQNLQSQGKKVLLSFGGAATTISLDNSSERDTFISTVNSLLAAYGFDGIDIDLEGSSVSISGGTIDAPVDPAIINLIDAIRQIMNDYRAVFNRRLLLTMAPETAYVQGGMSAYGGIWGAYLPILHALRDSIEILHVQLYNSGSVYGIDGSIYYQGTADFIVAMTEAIIHGFNTSGGAFAGLPAHHVAVGLPACPNAAGGGFTDTSTVRAALNYLRGLGPQPGSYVLVQNGGYPDLRGMMTWSINWDASPNCNSSYEFAENFERLFPGGTAGLSEVSAAGDNITVFPNPASSNIRICGPGLSHKMIEVYDLFGQEILRLNGSDFCVEIETTSLEAGVYLIRCGHRQTIFIKQCN